VSGTKAPTDSRREGSGPPPASTSLAELTSAAAVRDPAAVALAIGGRRLTFAELDRAVGAMADELLDRGVQPGDAIAVLAGNGLEFPVLAHAVLRAGAVLVPISASSPVPEVTGLLQSARVEMVLTDGRLEDVARESATMYDSNCGAVTLDATAERSRGDRLALNSLAAGPPPAPPPRLKPGAPAAILFTSGSTTHPKGVVHSHEGLFRNALCVISEMTSLNRNDVMLGALPMAHSFGFSAVLNASLLAGARVELMDHFDASEAWRLVKTRGVTVLTGVPAMYRRLATAPEATRNTDLRLAVVSGSTCPREVARQVRLRMGVRVIERYGMTEASPLTWREVTDESPAGDVGWPGWGVHVRVVGESGKVLTAESSGELEVQSPGMLLRYLRADDNRDGFDDGWLRTGDFGRIREDGGITIESRLKEVILRGGYSISALEVEQVLTQHRAVQDAAVVGVPHPDIGEELAAAVVWREGSTAETEDLERFMAKRLAAWKRPRLWRVVDEIPRTPLGKVKREVIAGFWAGSSGRDAKP
jgi:long-chain acyl-CoA synthetase